MLTDINRFLKFLNITIFKKKIKHLNTDKFHKSILIKHYVKQNSLKLSKMQYKHDLS